MALQLDDLLALEAPAEASGVPLLLALDAIDEDPEQPRREFDATALQELAETVRQRGVKSPISVRPHPTQPGRWTLNFGARRLRAARLAGQAHIPAFIDTSADGYDQLIENEQREGLRPLELAMFVQKRLQRGESQADIARHLGKSRQWVSLVTALIEPPGWLLQAYREGRCTGLKELHELRRLHAEQPQEIEAWVGGQNNITRSRVEQLKAELKAPHEAVTPVMVDPDATADPGDPATSLQDNTADLMPGQSGLKGGRTDPPAKCRLQVESAGQRYKLLVSAVPDEAGHFYVRPLSGGSRIALPAAALKLIGFVVD